MKPNPRSWIVHVLALSALHLITGCAETDSSTATEDSAPLGSMSTQLTSAVSFMSDSIPKLKNQVGSSLMPKKSVDLRDLENNVSLLGTTSFITPTTWVSSSSADRLLPPGGTVTSSDPTYGGAAIPASVNFRDYMKMALDKDFKRMDSGVNLTFRPTIFGRLDDLIDLVGYMVQGGITFDATTGLPSTGTFNVSLTIQNMSIRVIAEVSATTSSTLYDRKMDIFGFIDANANQTFDTGEMQVFRNLAWMKASSTQLNMMHVELGTSSEPQFTASILNWNKSTGNLRLEYVSNPDDTVSNRSFEHFRLLIEGTGGKAWVYGLQGSQINGATNQNFVQWALYTPSSTATEGTFSVRYLDGTGDIRLGNVCAAFATGVGTTGDAITSETDAFPSAGGTCTGQSADAINTKAGIMSGANLILSHTTAAQTATAKGFPAATAPDWSTAANRTAWLTAGESITVSFSNRTGFISSFGSAP